MRPFLALLTLSWAASSLALDIQVTQTQKHAIPPTLYGYMWEDINHSGDGGLYAELLQNRAFQVVAPGSGGSLAGWAGYKNTALVVTSSTPGVSSALKNSLQATISGGSSGPVGFQNTGYWGIKVQSGWLYKGSFWVKSPSYTGSVTVSLVSQGSGTVYATQTLSGVTNAWKKFTFQFQPSASAPDTNNVFRVTVDGASASNKQLFFGMFSLFPPTYKNRPNGMRVDLAETLAATKPGVWRFPGGNNLEGGSVAGRWKWDATIGPLENRPGRQGTWGYANTDGLGLMEYMDWAEDIGAEPILGVWAGLYLGNSPSSNIVPEGQVQQYVQEAVNEIQFLTGDANTNQYAKLRAQYGRTQPYKLRYIEVGNEDWVEPNSYASYRWKSWVNGIKAAFPNSGFKFIATTYPSTALSPTYDHIDLHQYDIPSWFIKNALAYDNYSRSGAQIFFGEYAVTSTNPDCRFGSVSCGRLAYPTLQGAVAEAAFMTGLERNSDVIFASAYAPSLQNIASTQWTPNIATFNANTLVKSASYFVQLLFGSNRGTHVLQTNPAPSSSVPMHWVASYDANNKVVYLKVANTATSTYPATFKFPSALRTTSIGLTLLTGTSLTAANDLNNMNAVTTKGSTITVASGATSFSYTLPASSVAVFKVPVNF